MTDILKIATRKSSMALWQANFIKSKLSAIYPDLQIKLVGKVTQGDRDLNTALTNLGGKSLFVKELQQALLTEEADIAVHCIKDMSVYPHPQLVLGAVCERDDPRDAFVSNQYQTLEELPQQAIIGTASPRRACLIKSIRPDAKIKLLRGNVNTRLAKLDNGNYDAIILAAAGLQRLELSHRIQFCFDPTQFVPAIGQGALGIECRQNDDKILKLIRPLHHELTATCIEAEQAVNQTLGGDCHTPIGAYASINDNELILRGVVGSENGKTILQKTVRGKPAEAKQIGFALAEHLIAKGANALLQK